MAFKKKTWSDRMVEYAGRRKLTNVSTKQAIICDVERSEGTVSKEGDAFSSQNMNDLEQRVADGFSEVKQTTDGLIQNLNGFAFKEEGGVKYVKGADSVWVPFSNPEVYFAQCSFPGDQSTIPFTVNKSTLWLLTNADWFTSQYQNQLKLQIGNSTVSVTSYTKYDNCFIAKYDIKQYINKAASLTVNRSMVYANAYNYIILIGV